MADGLRIYFDFILKDYLLYKQEIEQASILLSMDYLKNFTYIGSEKQYANNFLFKYFSFLIKIAKYIFRSLDAVFAFKHGSTNAMASEHAEHQSSIASEFGGEEHSTKRRLRSHKNTEENEIILDLGAVAQHSAEVNSNNSSDSGTTAQVNQMSSMSLLRQLLPVNMAVPLKTRELLQDILAWQILPSDVPAEPSMIYGSVHLSRLIVKLPDFVNATPTMSDDKLKLLLQYLDCFIEYVFMIIIMKNYYYFLLHFCNTKICFRFLETHKEWFTEDQYKDAIKIEESN